MALRLRCPSFRSDMPPSLLTRRTVTLGLVAASVLPGRAVPAPEKLDADIGAVMEPLVRQYDIPGLAVGVTKAGRSHVFARGVAARGETGPVTGETLFEIGSVSKVFTATVAGLAVARGAITLADHPGAHWDLLRGAPIDAATLADLGTYAAGGLPLQFPAEVRGEDFGRYFRAWQPSAPPGTMRLYSNPSIGLLGHVAARALGRGYADLVETELLPGLGLRDSFVRVPAAAMPRYASGHDGATRVRVTPGPLDAEAYGIKSSAADMIRFLDAHLAPAGLEGALRSAVEATQIGHLAVDGMVQGLGWEQYPYPVPLERLLAGNSPRMLEPQPATRIAPPRGPTGPTLFNKTGSTRFGAYAAIVPARKLGLVMLANRNWPIPARVTAAHALLRLLDDLPELP